MAVLDEDLCAGLRLVEGDDGIWSSDASVRCGARRAQRDARRSLHRGRKAACRAGRRRARGQGAALAAEPSRGAVRLPRPAPGAAGQQSRRKDAQRAGDRKTALVRLRQPDRRPVHCRDVLGHRHARLEPHRYPALAPGMAGRLREERRQTAGRPVALAAMVDERGGQARLHGGGMTGKIECRYYGRDFTVGEMALLRTLIAAEPQPTRAALSREFCQRIGWLKPDGGLKDMMARVVMLAMHKDGLIELPPPRGPQHRPKPMVFGPDTEPPLLPAPTTLDEVRPLDLRPVVRETRAGRLWNEFVARYHYLGFKTLVGAQMRYAVHDRNGWPVAMLGFSTAAWEARAARQLHRLDAAEAREEPLPRRRQPEVPDPALDRNPQPRLAYPRHRPPTPAPGLDRALQHHPRACRNLRRDPEIHRRRLQGVRLDPCRDHPGAWAL